MVSNKHKTSEEETWIELDKEDCALVIREDGKIELIIPSEKEGGQLSMGAFMISALAIALQTDDDEVFDLLSQKMAQRAEELEEE